MGYLAFVWRSSGTLRLVVMGSLAVLAASIVVHVSLVHIPRFAVPAPAAFPAPRPNAVVNWRYPPIEFAIEPRGWPHASHTTYAARYKWPPREGDEEGAPLWQEARAILESNAALGSQFKPLLEDDTHITTRVANRSAAALNLVVVALEIAAFSAIGLIMLAFVLAIALRPWLFGRRHLCHRCFYDLQGVEAVFCPECGHPTG